MGLLNIIRRMHLRQNLSIREIARLTGVSRNTVTKHLAANTIEPKFATPDRQSKIDPFADTRREAILDGDGRTFALVRAERLGVNADAPTDAPDLDAEPEPARQRKSAA